MNEQVPFTWLRQAIFVVTLTTIAGTFAANHLVGGRLEDDLVDIGLCIMAACVLLGKLLHLTAQKMMNRENTWRLRNCEHELNRHGDRINGFDRAITSWFDEDELPTLYAVGSVPAPAPAGDPAATTGSIRAADVLAFRPPEWTR